jgi:hypothetical protein
MRQFPVFYALQIVFLRNAISASEFLRIAKYSYIISKGKADDITDLCIAKMKQAKNQEW